ncbi:alpha/beta fold hydrolase [Phyllobacterium meliloti]|uniref:alpha/beta fold hydrolase n=1 Tax=Phyllobacterium meliloti TaxID=555317 RepID=UPI001F284BCF|nr:alpha/beta hydrolase [Phyllobacterium sp. T1293]UGX88466.1 alpha/beta hydrolase [Phyllobacterium sp. T1293]
MATTEFSQDRTTSMQGDTKEAVPATTIVLVHGAFVDGSGWRAVHDRLNREGYRVVVVQNAIRSLEDDVANTRRAIDAAPGNVILVGHSYGGVVISEAGNNPKVISLVYVAAFVADAGESVQTLTANHVPGGSKPPFLPTGDGYILFDTSKFPQVFGGDLPLETSSFMAAALKPWGIASMAGKVTAAAWRAKPSWYVVATDDRLVDPNLQRQMAQSAGAHIVEVAGSHAIYMTQPETIAMTVVQAARATADCGPNQA